MKKTFQNPSIEMTRFAVKDIITTSGDENTPTKTPNNDYIDVKPTPQPVIPF